MNNWTFLQVLRSQNREAFFLRELCDLRALKALEGPQGLGLETSGAKVPEKFFKFWVVLVEFFWTQFFEISYFCVLKLQLQT